MTSFNVKCQVLGPWPKVAFAFVTTKGYGCRVDRRKKLNNILWFKILPYFPFKTVRCVMKSVYNSIRIITHIKSITDDDTKKMFSVTVLPLNGMW